MSRLAAARRAVPVRVVVSMLRWARNGQGRRLLSGRFTGPQEQVSRWTRRRYDLVVAELDELKSRYYLLDEGA